MKFLFLILLVSTPFSLGSKGKKRCPEGSRHILSAAECATACTDLDIPTSDDHVLMNWQKCYKGGKKNVCNQDGMAGSGASLICKNRRNSILNDIYMTSIYKLSVNYQTKLCVQMTVCCRLQLQYHKI